MCADRRTPALTDPAPVDPVLVEVWRGDSVESRHRGAVAIVDTAGQLRFSAGDIDRPVYPRSAIKPLQAITMVESGAAARFSLNDARISLACASHGGEKMHTEAVEQWLASVSLGVADLRCGAHRPLYEPAADELVRRGIEPGRQHNNCSGKHCGFLTLARHGNHSTDDYLDFGHASQVAWRNTVSELADDDLEKRPRGIDGCGIPVVAVPLRNIARAMARFAQPRGESRGRVNAIEQIHRALAAHPEMIAGTGRFCSFVIQASAGAALIKTGAEGVYTAALPHLGMGIALKIDDGARRASEYLMAELLARFGELDDNAVASIRRRQANPLLNAAGRSVGELRAGAGLTSGQDSVR